MTPNCSNIIAYENSIIFSASIFSRHLETCDMSRLTKQSRIVKSLTKWCVCDNSVTLGYIRVRELSMQREGQQNVPGLNPSAAT